jgi:tetratricopeptide (TPR) repeat protein
MSVAALTSVERTAKPARASAFAASAPARSMACGVALAVGLAAGGAVAQTRHTGDASAEALVREGRYAEAYELLGPLQDARGGDAWFDYLLGRAALGTRRAGEAKRLFERALRQRPELVEARLALGRAYYALGRYAEAEIEFETVLRLDNLPGDLESRVQIYAEAARQVLEDGRRLVVTSFVEIGAGRYRTNATRATRDTGDERRQDTFYDANAGASLSYALDNDYTLNGSARYDFRYFANDGVRNDSDVRWRGGASRGLGEGNLAFGLVGRVSYRGDGQYRNDYGVFTDYRYRIDEDNQVTVGALLQRRSYPEGPLRERSRTLADISVSWTRALFGGAGSLTLMGHGGYQYATSRPDGDAPVAGVQASIDYAFSELLGGYLLGMWERNRFNADAIHYHPDALDEAFVLRRRDNLYEVEAGLVWELAPTWTLRPRILYIRDESNAMAFNYSATEAWLTVRKDF